MERFDYILIFVTCKLICKDIIKNWMFCWYDKFVMQFTFIRWLNSMFI